MCFLPVVYLRLMCLRSRRWGEIVEPTAQTFDMKIELPPPENDQPLAFLRQQYAREGTRMHMGVLVGDGEGGVFESDDWPTICWRRAAGLTFLSPSATSPADSLRVGNPCYWICCPLA